MGKQLCRASRTLVEAWRSQQALWPVSPGLRCISLGQRVVGSWRRGGVGGKVGGGL